MTASRRWTGMALMLSLMLLLRIIHIYHASIEVDEFQHLHAAYLVARGETPYADFFEHHTPLFYFLGGALIDPNTASFDTILRFRWITLAAQVATIGIGTALAASAGVATAVATLVLLCAEIFSFAWGTLTFLDSYAVPLVLLSALLLARRPRARMSFVVAGILISTAVLFTQKAVFAAGGAVLFALAPDFGGSRRPVDERISAVACLAAGAMIPLMALPWLLGVEGVRGLWNDAVVLNSAWKARRWPLGEAFIIASYGAPIWFLAGVGVLSAGYRIARHATPSATVLVPALYFATFLCGTLLLPVVWYEYFIEIGPFAALVAGFVAVDLARLAGLLPGDTLLLPASRAMFSACVAGLLAVSAFSLGLRLTNHHYSPSLSEAGLAATLGAGTACLVTALRAQDRGRGPRAALAWLCLVCVLPFAGQVGWLWRRGNDPQRDAVNFVLARTGVNDAVFDGYSGFGVFRPHAYRYWFLHEEMVQMLSPQELRDDIIQALANPRVKIAVRDSYIRALDGAVQQYLDTHFAHAWRDIWVRRNIGQR